MTAPRSDSPRSRLRWPQLAVLTVALAGASVLGGAAVATAQPSPAGSDFQVNSYTLLDQRFSSIDTADNGDFVVVWWGELSSGPGPERSIHARLFSASGAPRTDEFPVSPETDDSSQTFPDVAMSPDGSFVVAWRSQEYTTYATVEHIRARRFDADGTPLGPELGVNEAPLHNLGLPTVATDALGRFVVAWQNFVSTGLDTSLSSIRARRFAPSGAPSGPEFLVNSLTTGYQLHPAVAMHRDGRFIVSWLSHAVFGRSGDIHAQRFAANGDPIGGELQVNNGPEGDLPDQIFPAIAVDASARFVVAWQSTSGGLAPGNRIEARRFAADGTPLDNTFQVNGNTMEYPTWGGAPTVGTDSAGNFVVSWSTDLPVPGDDDGAVLAREYRADGASLGVAFVANAHVPTRQSYPAVAVDPRGDFILTWTSSSSPGDDDSGMSILARRFDALFRDGFESADTSRWSAATT